MSQLNELISTAEERTKNIVRSTAPSEEDMALLCQSISRLEEFCGNAEACLHVLQKFICPYAAFIFHKHRIMLSVCLKLVCLIDCVVKFGSVSTDDLDSLKSLLRNQVYRTYHHKKVRNEESRSFSDSVNTVDFFIDLLPSVAMQGTAHEADCLLRLINWLADGHSQALESVSIERLWRVFLNPMVIKSSPNVMQIGHNCRNMSSDVRSLGVIWSDDIANEDRRVLSHRLQISEADTPFIFQIMMHQTIDHKQYFKAWEDAIPVFDDSRKSIRDFRRVGAFNTDEAKITEDLALKYETVWLNHLQECGLIILHWKLRQESVSDVANGFVLTIFDTAESLVQLNSRETIREKLSDLIFKCIMEIGGACSGTDESFDQVTEDLSNRLLALLSVNKKFSSIITNIQMHIVNFKTMNIGWYLHIMTSIFAKRTSLASLCTEGFLSFLLQTIQSHNNELKFGQFINIVSESNSLSVLSSLLNSLPKSAESLKFLNEAWSDAAENSFLCKTSHISFSEKTSTLIEWIRSSSQETSCRHEGLMRRLLQLLSRLYAVANDTPRLSDVKLLSEILDVLLVELHDVINDSLSFDLETGKTSFDFNQLHPLEQCLDRICSNVDHRSSAQCYELLLEASLCFNLCVKWGRLNASEAVFSRHILAAAPWFVPLVVNIDFEECMKQMKSIATEIVGCVVGSMQLDSFDPLDSSLSKKLFDFFSCICGAVFETTRSNEEQLSNSQLELSETLGAILKDQIPELLYLLMKQPDSVHASVSELIGTLLELTDAQKVEFMSSFHSEGRSMPGNEIKNIKSTEFDVKMFSSDKDCSSKPKSSDSTKLGLTELNVKSMVELLSLDNDGLEEKSGTSDHRSVLCRIPVDRENTRTDNISSMVMTSATLENIRRIQDAAIDTIPILLEGDTGVGKSSSVKAAADGFGRELIRFNMSSKITIDDIIGRMMLQNDDLIWIDGPLTTAFRNGYWLLLDELNLAQDCVLKVLEAAIDSGTLRIGCNGSELIQKHDKFRLFATQNPSIGFFKGMREDQSTELLSRFKHVMFQSLSPADYKTILIAKFSSISHHTVDNMIAAHESLRQLFDHDFPEKGSYVQISFRELLKLAQIVDQCCRKFPSENVNKTACVTALLVYGSRMRNDQGRSKVQDVIQSAFNAVPEQLEHYIVEISVNESQMVCNSVSKKIWTQPEQIDFNNFMYALTRVDRETINLAVKLHTSVMHLLLSSSTIQQQGLVIAEKSHTDILNGIIQQCNGNLYDYAYGVYDNFFRTAELKRELLNVFRMRQFRPTFVVDSNYKQDKVVDVVCITNRLLRVWQLILLSLNISQPIMVIGEDGCGKSVAVRSILWIIGKPLMEVLITPETEIGALVGQYQPSCQSLDGQSSKSIDWNDGLVTIAVKERKVLLLDALNTAEASVLERLNSLLEDPPQWVLSEKGGNLKDANLDYGLSNGFQVLATMSFPSILSGAAELSPALYNRFTIITMMAPDKAEYEEIISCLFLLGKNDQLISKIADICRSLENTKTLSMESKIDWRKIVFLLKSTAFLLKNPRGDLLHAFPSVVKSYVLPLLEDSVGKELATNMQEKFPISATRNDIGNNIDDIIRKIRDCDHVVTPSRVCYVESLLFAANYGIPVLLEGPAAVGKTTMILSLAAAMGTKVERVNNSDSTVIQDYIGCLLPNAEKEFIFEKGSLVRAMENGAWFLADEFNLAHPSVLSMLQPLLEGRGFIVDPTNGRTFKAKASFRFFATQNAASYANRNKLPQSLRSRFLEIQVGEFSAAEVIEIIKRLQERHEYKFSDEDIKKIGKLYALSNGSTSGFPIQSMTMRDIVKLQRRWEMFSKNRANVDWDLVAMSLFAVRVADVEVFRSCNEFSAVVNPGKYIESNFQIQVCDDRIKFSLTPPHGSPLEVLLDASQFEDDKILNILYKINDGSNCFSKPPNFVASMVHCAFCVSSNEPVLLFGPTCYKSCLIQLFVRMHSDIENSSKTMNLTQDTETSDFMGKLYPISLHELINSIPRLVYQLMRRLELILEVKVDGTNSLHSVMTSWEKESQKWFENQKIIEEGISMKKKELLLSLQKQAYENGDTKSFPPKLPEKFEDEQDKFNEESEDSVALPEADVDSEDSVALPATDVDSESFRNSDVSDFSNIAHTAPIGHHSSNMNNSKEVNYDLHKDADSRRELESDSSDSFDPYSSIPRTADEESECEFEGLDEEMKRYAKQQCSARCLSKSIRSLIERFEEFIGSLDMNFPNSTFKEDSVVDKLLSIISSTFNILKSENLKTSTFFQFVDGPVTLAAKYSKSIILENFDSPNQAVTERLNPLLESNPSLILSEDITSTLNGSMEVKIKEGFQVFATVHSDHAKKINLSPATLSRFTKIYAKPYTDVDVEEIIKSLTKDGNVAKRMIDLRLFSQVEKAFSSDQDLEFHSLIRTMNFIYKCSDNQLNDINRVIELGCRFFYLNAVDKIRQDNILGKVFGSTCDGSWILDNIDHGVFLLNSTRDRVELWVKELSLPIDPHAFSSQEDLNMRSQLVYCPTACRNIAVIFSAMICDAPILLEGPPGVGKTEIVKQVAEMLDCKCCRINMSANSTLDLLLGSLVPTVNELGERSFVWRDGPVTKALLDGNWILFDEINLSPSDVLDALSPLLYPSTYFIVPDRPSPKILRTSMRVFATMNPSSIGGGRSKLPRSIKNAFCTVNLGMIDELEMNEIVKNIFRVNVPSFPLDLIDKLLTFHHSVNELTRTKKIGDGRNNYEFNLRDLIRVMDLLKSNLFDYLDHNALHATFEDDLDSLSDVLGKFVDVVYISRFRDANSKERVWEELKKYFSIKKFDFALPIDENVDGSVRILNSYIDQHNHKDYSLLPLVHDKETSECLEKLAISINSRLPVLLEGESGSVKTSLVHELARLSRRKLVQINLTQDTEVSDIIGQWSQNLGTSYNILWLSMWKDVKESIVCILSIICPKLSVQLRYELLSELRAAYRNFNSGDKWRNRSIDDKKEETKDGQAMKRFEFEFEVRSITSLLNILKFSLSELSKESMKCTSLIHLLEIKLSEKKNELDRINSCQKSANFVFEYSELVTAIKSGDWVLLEGVNSAPQDVLERLNPLLEEKPSLSIYEHGKKEDLCRGGGIADSFRIFLTANLRRIDSNKVSSALLNRVLILPVSALDDGLDVFPTEMFNDRKIADVLSVVASHRLTFIVQDRISNLIGCKEIAIFIVAMHAFMKSSLRSKTILLSPGMRLAPRTVFGVVRSLLASARRLSTAKPTSKVTIASELTRLVLETYSSGLLGPNDNTKLITAVHGALGCNVMSKKRFEEAISKPRIKRNRFVISSEKFITTICDFENQAFFVILNCLCVVLGDKKRNSSISCFCRRIFRRMVCRFLKDDEIEGMCSRLESMLIAGCNYDELVKFVTQYGKIDDIKFEIMSVDAIVQIGGKMLFELQLFVSESSLLDAPERLNLLNNFLIILSLFDECLITPFLISFAVGNSELRTLCKSVSELKSLSELNILRFSHVCSSNVRQMLSDYKDSLSHPQYRCRVTDLSTPIGKVKSTGRIATLVRSLQICKSDEGFTNLLHSSLELICVSWKFGEDLSALAFFYYRKRSFDLGISELICLEYLQNLRLVSLAVYDLSLNMMSENMDSLIKRVDCLQTEECYLRKKRFQSLMENLLERKVTQELQNAASCFWGQCAPDQSFDVLPLDAIVFKSCAPLLCYGLNTLLRLDTCGLWISLFLVKSGKIPNFPGSNWRVVLIERSFASSLIQYFFQENELSKKDLTVDFIISDSAYGACVLHLQLGENKSMLCKFVSFGMKMPLLEEENLCHLLTDMFEVTNVDMQHEVIDEGFPMLTDTFSLYCLVGYWIRNFDHFSLISPELDIFFSEAKDRRTSFDACYDQGPIGTLSQTNYDFLESLDQGSCLEQNLAKITNNILAGNLEFRSENQSLDLLTQNVDRLSQTVVTYGKKAAELTDDDLSSWLISAKEDSSPIRGFISLDIIESTMMQLVSPKMSCGSNRKQISGILELIRPFQLLIGSFICTDIECADAIELSNNVNGIISSLISAVSIPLLEVQSFECKLRGDSYRQLKTGHIESISSYKQKLSSIFNIISRLKAPFEFLNQINFEKALVNYELASSYDFPEDVSDCIDRASKAIESLSRVCATHRNNKVCMFKLFACGSLFLSFLGGLVDFRSSAIVQTLNVDNLGSIVERIRNLMLADESALRRECTLMCLRLSSDLRRAALGQPVFLSPGSHISEDIVELKSLLTVLVRQCEHEAGISLYAASFFKEVICEIENCSGGHRSSSSLLSNTQENCRNFCKAVEEFSSLVVVPNMVFRRIPDRQFDAINALIEKMSTAKKAESPELHESKLRIDILLKAVDEMCHEMQSSEKMPYELISECVVIQASLCKLRVNDQPIQINSAINLHIKSVAILKEKRLAFVHSMKSTIPTSFGKGINSADVDKFNVSLDSVFGTSDRTKSDDKLKIDCASKCIDYGIHQTLWSQTVNMVFNLMTAHSKDEILQDLSCFVSIELSKSLALHSDSITRGPHSSSSIREMTNVMGIEYFRFIEKLYSDKNVISKCVESRDSISDILKMCNDLKTQPLKLLQSSISISQEVASKVENGLPRIPFPIPILLKPIQLRLADVICLAFGEFGLSISHLLFLECSIRKCIESGSQTLEGLIRGSVQHESNQMIEKCISRIEQNVGWILHQIRPDSLSDLSNSIAWQLYLWIELAGQTFEMGNNSCALEIVLKSPELDKLLEEIDKIREEETDIQSYIDEIRRFHGAENNSERLRSQNDLEMIKMEYQRINLEYQNILQKQTTEVRDKISSLIIEVKDLFLLVIDCIQSSSVASTTRGENDNIKHDEVNRQVEQSFSVSKFTINLDNMLRKIVMTRGISRHSRLPEAIRSLENFVNRLGDVCKEMDNCLMKKCIQRIFDVQRICVHALIHLIPSLEKHLSRPSSVADFVEMHEGLGRNIRCCTTVSLKLVDIIKSNGSFEDISRRTRDYLEPLSLSTETMSNEFVRHALLCFFASIVTPTLCCLVYLKRRNKLEHSLEIEDFFSSELDKLVHFGTFSSANVRELSDVELLDIVISSPCSILSCSEDALDFSRVIYGHMPCSSYSIIHRSKFALSAISPNVIELALYFEPISRLAMGLSKTKKPKQHLLECIEMIGNIQYSDNPWCNINSIFESFIGVGSLENKSGILQHFRKFCRLVCNTKLEWMHSQLKKILGPDPHFDNNGRHQIGIILLSAFDVSTANETNNSIGFHVGSIIQHLPLDVMAANGMIKALDIFFEQAKSIMSKQAASFQLTEISNVELVKFSVFQALNDAIPTESEEFF